MLTVLVVSGDQSMHQLWRMQHGEIFQTHQPHVAVVMIGTNDLGAASCLGEGEAPILQAAAGTADRSCSLSGYLHILYMIAGPRVGSLSGLYASGPLGRVTELRLMKEQGDSQPLCSCCTLYVEWSSSSEP